MPSLCSDECVVAMRCDRDVKYIVIDQYLFEVLSKISSVDDPALENELCRLLKRMPVNEGIVHVNDEYLEQIFRICYGYIKNNSVCAAMPD
ncbi:hypothetical protein [Methanofollis fontis]|nr:hypothetical protein [Methanofollis fontis]